MYYISEEIRRVNSAEADLGDMRLIDDKFVVAFCNLDIMDGGEDVMLNEHISSYINFCYVVFEGVDTITFDYDMSRLIPLEKRKCYGGINYLTNQHSEFWISYKTGKILFTEKTQFKKIPQFFTREELRNLLHQNPITPEVLLSLGVLK